jgi:hypothetical protein
LDQIHDQRLAGTCAKGTPWVQTWKLACIGTLVIGAVLISVLLDDLLIPSASPTKAPRYVPAAERWIEPGAGSHTGSLGQQVVVRGGSHSVADRATVDGGMMIDLSLMKGIDVDVKSRLARVKAGVTWAELNRETQPPGLAVADGVVCSTGTAECCVLGNGPIGSLRFRHHLELSIVNQPNGSRTRDVDRSGR